MLVSRKAEPHIERDNRLTVKGLNKHLSEKERPEAGSGNTPGTGVLR